MCVWKCESCFSLYGYMYGRVSGCMCGCVGVGACGRLGVVARVVHM